MENHLLSILIPNCIGVCLVILTWFCSRQARNPSTLDNRLFSVLLAITGSCCLMEMVTFIIDGHRFPGAFVLAKISNTWLFFFNLVFCTLWCLYVDYRMYRSRTRLKTVFRPLLAMTTVFCVTILGNVFGEYLFTFGSDNVYQRKPLSYIFFIVPALYVLISAWDVHDCKKKRRGLSFFPIWAFLTPFFIGCAIQAMVYGVSIAWCSVAISLVAVYMSLQNELVYQDPLTHLLNRHYLNYVFQSADWTRSGDHSGIMLDMDDFKSINDTYGHTMGDEALSDTAHLIRKAAPEDATIIRFAGDEFIILLMHADEVHVQKTMDDIQDAIRQFNEKKTRPYHLSLSMGYASYKAGSTTQDTFLEDMDHAMYENKRARHSSGELKERRNR